MLLILSIYNVFLHFKQMRKEISSLSTPWRWRVTLAKKIHWCGQMESTTPEGEEIHFISSSLPFQLILDYVKLQKIKLYSASFPTSYAWGAPTIPSWLCPASSTARLSLPSQTNFNTSIAVHTYLNIIALLVLCSNKLHVSFFRGDSTVCVLCSPNI